MSSLVHCGLDYVPCPLFSEGFSDLKFYKVGLFVGSSFRCKRTFYLYEVAKNYMYDLMKKFPHSDVRIISFNLQYGFV